MRHSRPAVLVLLAAVAAVTGCYITTRDLGGAPCQTDADCNDAAYRCSADTNDPSVKRCLVIFPPSTGAQDAGPVDAGPTRTIYWCNDVEIIMGTYCANCHGEDRTQSGNLPFRLDIYEDEDGGTAQGGLDGAKTKAARIKLRMVDFKTMPPLGSGMPTDEERARVNDWVLSGAPFCDGGM